jgi:hypothetical protein
MAPTMGVPAAAAIQIAKARGCAGKIILSAYPDWKQRNMIAEGNGHTFKIATGGNTLTSAEVDRAAYLQSVWAWVQAVRVASGTIEDAVDTISVDAGKTDLQKVQDILDIDVDAHVAWPDDPPVEP